MSKIIFNFLTNTMKASFIIPEIQVNAIKSILIDEFKINNEVKLDFLGRLLILKDPIKFIYIN